MSVVTGLGFPEPPRTPNARTGPSLLQRMDFFLKAIGWGGQTLAERSCVGIVFGGSQLFSSSRWKVLRDPLERR